MEDQAEIRTGRHCAFNLHVHLVFVTKYRKKVFTKEILKSMNRIMTKVCDDFEADLVEFDGERDHVHLLINYPPKVSVSKMVNSLKGSAQDGLSSSTLKLLSTTINHSSGAPVILPALAEDPPSKPSDNTSNNSKLLTNRLSALW